MNKLKTTYGLYRNLGDTFETSRLYPRILVEWYIHFIIEYEEIKFPIILDEA
jgi:hypothetical protein